MHQTVDAVPIQFVRNPAARSEPTPPEQKGRFHAMAKPIGSTCNINCTYCYYLHKEQLLDQHRGSRMEPSMLERYIRQYIEAQNGEAIIFSWQGGEPTMLGLDFFRDIVALQAKYKPAGQRIENDLQTNGILLTDEWCRFLKQHGFLVGVSIDGPRELHDTYRVDRKGLPTFDDVMRGIGLLDRRQSPECEAPGRRVSVPSQRGRFDLHAVHSLRRTERFPYSSAAAVACGFHAAPRLAWCASRQCGLGCHRLVS